ncbi:MAG: XcbB/CpsF family capsular polysaccharide biosynthesis protein [Lactobacillales bacterium]|jgi:hypothetical protein|nr:XcbB/CpsF family capsular polysaccharide biosynthesis protein [Lactobacillales bacterium]
MRSQTIDLFDGWNPDFDSDKIQIKTYSTSSVLQLARQSIDVHENTLELLNHDFMLGNHKEGISYFGKRTDWIWERKDILNYDGIFYSIDYPNEKYKGLKDKKMVIIFSLFAPDSNNAGARTFPNYFNDIRAHIPSNSIVVRIMDFNLSHGSFYLNTINYPDFEERIQGCIEYLLEENSVKQENIVLLGSYKGGTGALIHGILGNYKSLSIDPIVNENYYVEKKGDWHFTKGSRELDFVPKIIDDSKKYNNSELRKTLIISNSKVPETFSEISRLSNVSNIQIYDTENSLAYETHALVGPTSKFEMITLLNVLLNAKLEGFLKI